jgi:type I pantothenate kinase
VTNQVAVSRFLEFTRAEWAARRASTPLPLTEPQLRGLVSVNERMSLDEVADIYLPLSRLLNLHVGATDNLHQATATFLDSRTPRVPFVIGIAGSVAVGKSTASRVLQAFLSR